MVCIGPNVGPIRACLICGYVGLLGYKCVVARGGTHSRIAAGRARANTACPGPMRTRRRERRWLAVGDEEESERAGGGEDSNMERYGW